MSVALSQAEATQTPRFTTAQQERLVWLIYVGGALLFSALHFWGDLYFQQSQRAITVNRYTMILLAEGTASTPFQYRVLVPGIAHGLHAALHVPYPPLFGLLEFAAVLGTLWAFRRYLEAFLPPAFCRFGALALLYPMIWNYCLLGRLYFPYDIPSIGLFVLALACLIRERLGAYAAVFVLAVLNRETSVFLILAYVLLLWGRQPLPRLAAAVAAQAAFWLLVKLALTHLFAANGGEQVFQNKLGSNAALLTSALHGHFHFVRFLLTSFGAIWLLTPLAWKRQPAAFKRLLWIIPPFLLGMLVVGNLDEVRIYNELIPILTAPALWGIWVAFAPPEGAGRETAPTPAGQ